MPSKIFDVRAGLKGGVLLAAAGLLALATPAFAQPKAPAKSAAPVAAPAQPEGPTKVAVKPEPSQTDWLKVCGKDPATSKQICYTTRDFVADNNEPVLAVAVYAVDGDPEKIVRFLMPLGFLVQPGIRFGVDSGQQEAGRYAICFPNGCFAEAKVKDNVVKALKSGTTLNISTQNQVAKEVIFQVPLAGFAKAFDGPPVDPKVIEEQQKKLQAELQKRAEEMRKQQQQNAPAPAPAPAPKK